MSGELGPEARSFLDAGRDGDDPRPGDRARMRASVMQAIAIGGGAGAAGLGAVGKASASIAPKAAAGAAAMAKTAGTFGIAKIAGVVTLVAALGGGGYAVARRTATTAEPGSNAAIATTTAASVPSSPGASGQAPAPIMPTTASPVEEPGAEKAGADAQIADKVAGAQIAEKTGATSENGEKTSAAPSGEKAVAARAAQPAPNSGPAPVAAAAPGAAPEAVDPLIAETRQLRDATRALQAGDGKRALDLLDAPGDGQMSEERAATRVLALCKLGRVDEANAAAARFVSQHPHSVHVDRMRRPCSSDGSGR